MLKRVLSVGQCVPDQSAIARFLKQNFDVEVATADSGADAIESLRGTRCDLVLVNRKLDADYSDGLDVLRSIKEDPALAAVPVMLVSNYADAHKAAQGAGGEMGFGKAELGSPQVRERLAPFLA